MHSIKENVKTSIVINKSEFINYFIRVTSIDEVERAIASIKEKHRDANHYCSAYILGKNQDIQKVNDDGEPSKTAGYPMLEVLKKHDLTDVLSVTVRYFGGIKLGAGGLVRAYTKSIAESVKSAVISHLVSKSDITIQVSFDQIGVMEKFLRDNYNLDHTSYSDHVTYHLSLLTSKIDELTEKVSDYTKGSGTLRIIKQYETYE